MATIQDLQTNDKPNWCPGCGDFGIWVAVKNAVISAGLDIANTVLISGIGCSGKLPYWVNIYGFNGLHGRPLPVASAVKLANHKLTVIVAAGDGDTLAEGGNHFLHTMRRNANVTLILHNNQIYGLTTGQYSPTSLHGAKTKSSPHGAIEIPANPLALALTSGATFVARGFSGDTKQLEQLLVAAIKHKGFSLLDVLQPCVTFNKVNTFPYFFQRVYKVESEGYVPNNIQQALVKAMEWPTHEPIDPNKKERIPTGIIYQEERPTYEEQLPQLSSQPLVNQPIDNINITKLMEELV